MSAIYSYEYNKGIPEKMGVSVDNPMLDVVGNVVEATTNVPLARGVRKAQNIEEAINGNHEMWKRVALIMGWSKWDLNIEDADINQAREEVKIEKKQKKDEEKNKKKEEEAKQKEIDKKKKEEARKNRKDGDDLDGDGLKEYRCQGTTNAGSRCRIYTEHLSKKCYHHR